MSNPTYNKLPLAALKEPPLPSREVVEKDLQEALTGFRRKLVVLDDDPTGVQTVHDVPVYTDWSKESLLSGLQEQGTVFFVLTNSRSFSAEKTRRVCQEIGENLAWASERAQVPFLLMSRGDSTLRGHYPLETETLRDTLEKELGFAYDGEIILPFFAEGGRFTLGDIHYVREGDFLTPAGQTEFAKDTTFGYESSDLKCWCEEKTQGRVSSDEVCSVSLELLRSRSYDAITKILLEAKDFRRIIVNAADELDTKVFAVAYLRAAAQGKNFLFRCAASIVKTLSNNADRPLLTGEELVKKPGAGMIIVGSHVAKTTQQLTRLQERLPEIHSVCFDAASVLDDNRADAEYARVLKEVNEVMERGETVLVYTSRLVLRSSENDLEKNLQISAHISEKITALVADLTVPPAFVVAKGGITSSDVGVKALRVKRAMVAGQIAAGVPVWKTGEESRFPGIPYVIFPGNVGDADTLYCVVEKLLSASQKLLEG